MATDEQVRADALALCDGIAAFWQRRLSARLLGVYRVGSLAHGGFSRRYSDIDLAVVAEDGLAEADLAAMRTEAQGLSPACAPKLSLFWADRGFTRGRFPPLDRVDLVDHAVALLERERVRPPRPALAEIRDYLRGQPFTNWAAGAARFAALERLEPESHKPYLRAHLYPARFVYSWVTGGMASNDDAVALTRSHAPPGLDLALIERALDCRHEAADPDLLFPARGALAAQVAACAELFTREAASAR